MPRHSEDRVEFHNHVDFGVLKVTTIRGNGFARN